MQTEKRPRPAEPDAGAQVSGNGKRTPPPSENQEQDLEFECGGELPPLLPEGDQYSVVFVRADAIQLFRKKQKRVFLHFRILDPAEWAGTKLWLPCNGPPDGDYITPSYKYWRLWTLATGAQPRRRDRMSTKVFRGKVFRAVVHTVKTDRKQRARARYSVIEDLIEKVTG